MRGERTAATARRTSARAVHLLALLLLRCACAAALAGVAAAADADDAPAALATAGDASAGAASDESEPPRASKLAEEFSDPLTTLPQIFIQDAFTPRSYGTEARTNRVIARAIVPRIPRLTLLPFVQLLRPTLQLVTVPTGRGHDTVTALGDAQIFDLLVLPWPDRSTGLYMGAGPLLVFPTATDRRAGQGAWQAGPAFAAIYKGLPGVLLGGLVQNPISFAYTSDSRPPVSTLLAQPVALVYLGHGFYAKSADASWTVGWRRGTATLLPLSFGIGWVRVHEGSPPINLFVSGEWLAYRQLAPIAPQTTVRFGVTVAFPGYRWW